MNHKNIKIFRKPLSKTTAIILFFVAFIPAFMIFITAIVQLKDIEKSLLLSLIILFATWSMFAVATIIESNTRKKVEISQDEISTWNRKLNKRVSLRLNKLTSVKIEDYMLNEKYIVMGAYDTREEVMVPFPLKNWHEFVAEITTSSTLNQSIVGELIKITT